VRNSTDNFDKITKIRIQFEKAEKSEKTLKKMASSVLKFPNTEMKTVMPNFEA
jgi:hypothetical protein